MDVGNLRGVRYLIYPRQGETCLHIQPRRRGIDEVQLEL